MKGIFSAAKKGDLTFIQSQNIDETTTDDDGANCLHYVCRGGNVTLVEYLVNTKQFNVSKKTKFGSTAFHEAAASGGLDIVKWLWTNTQVNIDEGDDVGATPLHIAALYGQLLVVHWIINNTSCDLLLKTKKGATCLHFAVVGGNLQVVKLILTEIPRSINLQLDNGATPAYLACQYGHLEILKYLVEKNANMKMKSFDGMSYVHAASQGGHLDVVKWLVKEQGCNANDRDLDGASCLHFAATNGRASVVAWMMKEGGAKVTLDNLGGSPLHNAAELGHFEVIKALLDNGCDVNITDNDGLTAAELAEKCHQSGCAALIRGEFPSSDFLEKENSDNITHSNGINRLNTSNQTNQSDRQKPFIIQASNSFSNHFNHYPSYNRSSQSNFSQSDHDSFTNNTSSTTHDSLNSTDRNVTPEACDNLNTNSHDVHQEPPVHIPERDYPEDDDSLSSTESVTTRSIPADNYKSHQINPDNYEPPDLPPDTISEKDSENGSPFSLDKSNTTFSETDISTQVANGTDKSVVEEYISAEQESDLSSETSTLSSASRYDEVGKKQKTTDSSVHFSSDHHFINSPSASTQGSPASSPYRVSSPRASILSKVTEDHSSQANFVSTNVVEKRTVQTLRDNFQRKDSSSLIPTPPFPGIPPKVPTSASNLKPKGTRNMTESITAPKSDWLSELKQLHVSNSETNLNENDTNDQNGDSEVAQIRTNGNADHAEKNLPMSMTNGEVKKSPRPQLLTSSSSTGNLASMGSMSPVIGRSIVDELKKKDLSDLRVTKKPGEGKQVKMVFSFGDPSPVKVTQNNSSPVSTSNGNQKESKPKTPVLMGEFDPKNFMEKVPDVDPVGAAYPEWKKQLLARQLAEKALQESEEKKKQEEYEARFANMPAWKRQMIERKEFQAKQSGNK
ncbi:espin-like [Mytilus trossulus]|uniref:espin-like n=1 Tax=Mytilus trossulus TaxID=6551 RepID=UPI003005E7A5